MLNPVRPDWRFLISGKIATGLRAAAAIRETFHDQEEMRAFTVVDRDSNECCRPRAGFEGSLNLTTQQARDIGSAMGCGLLLYR